MSEVSELECSVGGPYINWTEPEYEVVWLLDERTYGYLLQQSAHYSKIRYTDKDGDEVEDDFENDDFELWKEHAIDYESE